eukprot:COSAG02_NODE_948_length_15709_cov_67.728700_19_plen_88_part_00
MLLNWYLGITSCTCNKLYLYLYPFKRLWIEIPRRGVLESTNRQRTITTSPPPLTSRVSIIPGSHCRSFGPKGASHTAVGHNSCKSCV